MHKRIRQLAEENRGLKKRLNAVAKASENNHNGLMYWKTKAQRLEGAVDLLNMVKDI